MQTQLQASPKVSRRDFFSWSSTGVGSAAFASLLFRDGLLRAAPSLGEADDAVPHFSPAARRVIHVVACGAMSHIDSFDFKPELVRRHGQSLGDGTRPDVFFGKVGLLRKPDWEFRQRGSSGLWVSDLFPHLARQADELTVIHSMVAETSNHTPATFQESTGFRLNGFPVIGAWLSYGLGAETENLPAYVVIPDARGVPAGGSINWSNGFLPARHQGVTMRSQGVPIDDLFPAREISERTERESRQLLNQLNRRHLETQTAAGAPADDALEARIRSYEMAARMQLSVPEVCHVDGETQATHAMYGLDHPEANEFGRSCLLARRLIERGVRFVQVFAGGAFGSPRINWDGHENMIQNHGREAARIDRPLAGLLRDLRQRGLLDDTLVLFTTEFGRTPFAQSNDGVLGLGRDHNHTGFTCWMAGAGLRPGMTYGATDEIGLNAVEHPVPWHDFHATVLHLLGIDHERLTYYHNGIDRRLTNVHGHVLRDILG